MTAFKKPLMQMTKNHEKTSKLSPRTVFLIHLCILACTFLLILLFSPIKYEVSDDFLMEALVSGAFSSSGTPNPHILFSNVIWGYILSLLYRITTSVSWYFILQLTVIVASYVAVSYVLSHRLTPGISIIFIILILIFTAKDLYILPQFTKTAIAAVISGSALFFYSSGWKKPVSGLVCGSLLVIVGSLIRFFALGIAAPFVALMLILTVLGMKTERNNDQEVNIDRRSSFVLFFAKRLLLPGIILIAFVLGCRLVNNLAYTSEEYTQLREFSQVRSDILDHYHPAYFELSEEFSQAGISENDYEMICFWCFSDEEFFSIEKMQTVLNVLENARENRSHSLYDFLNTYHDRGILKYPGMICCILSAILILAACTKGYFRYTILLIAGVCLIGIFLLGIFYLMYRFVYRVEFGIFYAATVTLCCFWQKREIAAYCTRPILITTTCVLALAVGVFTQAYSYIPQYHDETDTDWYTDYLMAHFYYSASYDAEKYCNVIPRDHLFSGFLEEVHSHPENLYVMDFFTTIQTFYYAFSPFDSAAEVFPDNVVYLSGAAERHPDILQDIRERGYENTLEALLHDNVYLVSNRTSDLILEYLRLHYDSSVELVPYETIDHYGIWEYR